jgi:hypothetical protein
MRVNIFICHTPFHNFITRNLCELKFSEPLFKNYIISSVEDRNKTGNFTFVVIRQGLAGKIIGLKEARSFFNSQVKKFKRDVEFFLPHIDGVLGNYIFHNSFLRKTGAKVNFYYDGILMLDAHRGLRTFPRLLTIKRLLSMSIFHYFILHKDVLPVHASRTNHIYTPLPEHTPGPIEKMIAVRFSSMAYDINRGHVVILGSDVGINLDLSYQRIISYCHATLGVKKVLFKPHHADKMHIFQKTMKSQNQTFNLVEGKACLEELIAELRPEFVIAPYLSSALINIKVIFGTAIRSVCMIEKELTETSLNEITHLAKSLGVEIVTFAKK